MRSASPRLRDAPVMILLPVIIPRGRRLAAFFLRPHWPRRLLLLGTALAHTLLVDVALDRARTVPCPRRLGGGGQPGRAVPRDHEPPVSRRVGVHGGFPAQGRRLHVGGPRGGVPVREHPEGLFTACLLGFLSTMTLVTVSQPLRPPVGGHRGHHAGERPAHPLPPPPPIAGGGVEVHPAVLGGDRGGAAGNVLRRSGGSPETAAA